MAGTPFSWLSIANASLAMDRLLANNEQSSLLQAPPRSDRPGQPTPVSGRSEGLVERVKRFGRGEAGSRRLCGLRPVVFLAAAAILVIAVALGEPVRIALPIGTTGDRRSGRRGQTKPCRLHWHSTGRKQLLRGSLLQCSPHQLPHCILSCCSGCHHGKYKPQQHCDCWWSNHRCNGARLSPAACLSLRPRSCQLHRKAAW